MNLNSFPKYWAKISSIDTIIYELYLDDHNSVTIFQYDLQSAYFLKVSSIPGHSMDYLLDYKMVDILLNERIIEPELSVDEFKIQYALGTVKLRLYKINKEMIKKYVAENKHEE